MINVKVSKYSRMLMLILFLRINESREAYTIKKKV